MSDDIDRLHPPLGRPVPRELSLKDWGCVALIILGLLLFVVMSAGIESPTPDRQFISNPVSIVAWIIAAIAAAAFFIGLVRTVRADEQSRVPWVSLYIGGPVLALGILLMTGIFIILPCLFINSHVGVSEPRTVAVNAALPLEFRGKWGKSHRAKFDHAAALGQDWIEIDPALHDRINAAPGGTLRIELRTGFFGYQWAKIVEYDPPHAQGSTAP